MLDINTLYNSNLLLQLLCCTKTFWVICWSWDRGFFRALKFLSEAVYNSSSIFAAIVQSVASISRRISFSSVSVNLLSLLEIQCFHSSRNYIYSLSQHEVVAPVLKKGTTLRRWSATHGLTRIRFHSCFLHSAEFKSVSVLLFSGSRYCPQTVCFRCHHSITPVVSLANAAHAKISFPGFPSATKFGFEIAHQDRIWDLTTKVDSS